MALYTIECEQYLGAGHSGAVTEKGKGYVELTDDEVNILVNLIKENETTDVEELDLENLYPEIYEKLDDAYCQIAYTAEELHWLWYGFYDDCYDYDEKELKNYCRQNCGFVFDYDKNDYMDEDGNIDEDYFEEQEDEAFREWLIKYLEGLEPDNAIKFFYKHLNAELNLDDVEYSVEIPIEIIEMAEETDA